MNNMLYQTRAISSSKNSLCRWKSGRVLETFFDNIIGWTLDPFTLHKLVGKVVLDY